ncbi:putative Transposable element Tc1 transposase-like 33 [Homarus americanus]|uniref:Putative Transposable element Tc1 transposase-like 33 n=1 Tax=Homarus americanus TaxID=6706 RepID=A0A8J5JIU0_HOMAM|nr:putative Transposable element Tc1 transposase-like 33 [Homarus americanus]
MNITQQRLTTHGQIIALREGLTVRAIADRLVVSTSTVTRLIRRYAETERRPRPRLTTGDEDATIIVAIQNNPFSNAVAIREALHLDVCAQTVRSCLHEAGKQHRVPAFAQQYVREDPEFWSRVVFTDEKTFASTNHGKIHLWRPNRTRYDRAHIYEVARSGCVTLSVWCYISLHGMGDVFQIHGRFTANKFLDIVRNQFLPSIQERNFPFPAGPITFINDPHGQSSALVFDGQQHLRLL